MATKKVKKKVAEKRVRKKGPAIPDLSAAIKLSGPPGPGAPKQAKAKPTKEELAAAKLAEETLLKHFEDLGKHVERDGVKGLQKMYAEARGELQHRLKSVGKGDQSVGAQQLRAMLKQVDAVSAKLGKGLSELLKDKGKSAAELGAQQGLDEYKVLAETFTGTEPVVKVAEPATFKGLVKGVDRSLLRRHQNQSKAWTLGAINQMEQKLAMASMTGKSISEATDDIMGEDGFEGERWRAERIVRTEMAYAHGAAKQRAMEKTAQETKKPLHKKLIETFDDRTGDDSFVLHGQVVPIDEPFKWRTRRGGVWVTIEYMHPPNRPNDRAVVIPWDPDWTPTAAERPLTTAQLGSAPTTRWRKHAGVQVPPNDPMASQR